MATIFTDAIYSIDNLGVVSNSYFSLSSASSEMVLLSAGALNASPVIGIAYNAADWTTGTALSARQSITLKPYSSGVASGDAPTTVSIGVSAAGTPQLSLLLKDRTAVTFNYAVGTTTYSIDLSAAVRDVSDKNNRRLKQLGYI